MDPEDRFGRALADAGYRACCEYDPEPFPVTSDAGRVKTNDKAWLSRLIKKVGLLFGAERIHITKLDQRWIYKDVDIGQQASKAHGKG